MQNANQRNNSTNKLCNIIEKGECLGLKFVLVLVCT